MRGVVIPHWGRTSDRRLKGNITPARTDYINDLVKIKVKKYNLKMMK